MGPFRTQYLKATPTERIQALKELDQWLEAEDQPTRTLSDLLVRKRRLEDTHFTLRKVRALMTLAEQLQRSRIAQWDANENPSRSPHHKLPSLPRYWAGSIFLASGANPKASESARSNPGYWRPTCWKRVLRGYRKARYWQRWQRLRLYMIITAYRSVATRVVNLALEQILREERPPRKLE